MTTHSRTLPLSGLRSLRNARTRIFVSGSDPLFGRGATRKTFGTTSSSQPDATGGAVNLKLWQPELLDRLQTPITRYRE